MKSQLICLVALCLVTFSLPAGAEVVSISPSAAVVLPADGHGSAVAVSFDLSPVPADEGRRIEEAFFEWSLPAIDDNSTVELDLFPILSSWSPAAAHESATAVVCSEQPAVSWDITPRDNQRNGRGYVRFNVRDLVVAWADSMRANNGVVIRTSDVSRTMLENELSRARLIVHYGYTR